LSVADGLARVGAFFSAAACAAAIACSTFRMRASIDWHPAARSGGRSGGAAAP
jgi:hypothetical protein